MPWPSSGWNPSLSPDGNKIVYLATDNAAAMSDSVDSVGRMDIINSDGSGVTTLITAPSDTSFVEPKFSPDGQKIIFAQTDSGDIDLYTIDIDGSNLVNLTNIPSYYEHLGSWSPDGKKIVFV